MFAQLYTTLTNNLSEATYYCPQITLQAAHTQSLSTGWLFRYENGIRSKQCEILAIFESEFCCCQHFDIESKNEGSVHQETM